MKPTFLLCALLGVVLGAIGAQTRVGAQGRGGPQAAADAQAFRAYDKATGRVVWEMELPSGTTAGPMTYMLRGKQYIVISVGARDHQPEYVALALP